MRHQDQQKHQAAAQARYQRDPAAFHAKNKRWKDQNVARVRLYKRAAGAVAYALKTGRLTRPDVCEDCLSPERRVTAAHHDYEQPLVVRWLCMRCHRLWDQAQPKTLAA